jgi:hypothetical protein
MEVSHIVIPVCHVLALTLNKAKRKRHEIKIIDSDEDKE